MHPPCACTLARPAAGLKWGEEGWRRMTWAKVFVLDAVADWGFNLVISDVDVVWFRDPLPLFAKHAHAGGRQAAPGGASQAAGTRRAAGMAPACRLPPRALCCVWVGGGAPACSLPCGFGRRKGCMRQSVLAAALATACVPPNRARDCAPRARRAARSAAARPDLQRGRHPVDQQPWGRRPGDERGRLPRLQHRCAPVCNWKACM